MTSWPSSNGGIRLRRRTSTGSIPISSASTIHHPLEHEGRFGSAGAAIRLDRRRVGVDAVDVFLDGRNRVRPRQHQAVKDRRNARRRGREIRAHAGPHGAAQAQDAAVARRGQLDLLHVIAAVRRRLVVLGSRLDPLHRAAELHRAEDGDEVALDLRDLAAEAAADLRRDHAQLSSGTPVTSDMMKRTMCGFCVVFQSVSSPVAGTNCATAPRVSIAVGISRCWMIRSRDDDFGVGERRVDVAAGDRPVERDVAGRRRRAAAARRRCAAFCGSTTAGSGS